MRFFILLLTVLLLSTPLVSAKEKGDIKIDKYPLKIFTFNPVYPSGIDVNNRHDTVKVNALIDEDGNTIDIQLIDSTGLLEFDSIAIKTAYKFKFKPAYFEKKPLRSWIRTEVIFDTSRILELGESLPEIIEFVKPKYPRLAAQAGIGGVVWVSVLVDSSGKVNKAQVYKSSGTRQLDESAVEAAYENDFINGTMNGEKIEMWFVYQIHFINDYSYFNPIINKY